MRQIIFDEETDADVLALTELTSEMAAVSDLLREHITNEIGLPVCGEVDFETDLLVTAALASDCDKCRLLRGVALVGDKAGSMQTAIGVRPEAEFEPQPMENADQICESARKNREGL
jgi:hypothetical protein